MFVQKVSLVERDFEPCYNLHSSAMNISTLDRVLYFKFLDIFSPTLDDISVIVTTLNDISVIVMVGSCF